MPTRNPKVSIIIPTFNSEKTLALCLQSIKNQTYQNIETIIIDGYSKDKTIQTAKQFKKTRILFLRSERCFARNFGAKKAKGVFVLFIDSDMELSSNVVEECVKLACHKSADAIIIPEESIGKGFVAECRTMEREMRVGGKFSEAPRFFRKTVFNHVGGFDEKLVSGEDFDLGNRIETVGYKTERCKTKIKHHEEELSTKKFVLKIYYYGKTLPSYVQKNPTLSIKTSCPIHIAKNLKLIRTCPKPFLELLFFKLVEYMTYTAGIISNLFNLQIPTHKKISNYPYEVSEPEIKRMKLTLRYMGSEPILDAGCGTGWLMAFLTKNGSNVVGLDLSRDSLLVNKKSFSEAKIVLGSVHQFPFPNNHFGTVVLFDVLEHVKEVSMVLSEIKRITKKGGRVLITLPNATGSYSLVNDVFKERILMKVLPLEKFTRYEPLKHHHRHVHHYSWWAKLLEEHGFTVVTHHNIEVLTPLLSVFLSNNTLKHMSYYDVQNADAFPSFAASEWFISCIKK